MPTDFLEQLAEMEVPELPEHFDRQLHQRVNRSLLAQQLVDLAVRGLPWAVLQLARALLGVLVYTTTGRFPQEQDKTSR